MSGSSERQDREFVVGADYVDSRLETFLRKHLGWPRPLAHRALRKGWVRVDGSRARGHRRLRAGEVVRITNYALPLPDLEAKTPTPPPQGLVERARASVRHEDPSLVVADKPSGQVVHRGSGHPYGWTEALGAAYSEPLTPVGRLDRDTSGLLVLGRGRAATRSLFASLRSGALRRTYTALVHGELARDSGQVDQPLAKSGGEGGEQVRPHPDGSPARTIYEVLRRLGGATLLEVHIETGRTHQIRAHLHALGHPLLGDPRYGHPGSRELTRRIGLGRLFLHAGRLELPHPTDGTLRSWEEPLPTGLEDCLTELSRSRLQ